jgi:hypothetical protein
MRDTLIDHERRSASVMTQPATQSGIAVNGRKLTEQLACIGEQNIVSLEKR